MGAVEMGSLNKGSEPKWSGMKNTSETSIDPDNTERRRLSQKELDEEEDPNFFIDNIGEDLRFETVSFRNK